LVNKSVCQQAYFKSILLFWCRSRFYMLEQMIKFNANAEKQHQRFRLLLSKPSSGYNTTKIITKKRKTKKNEKENGYFPAIYNDFK